MAFPTRGFHSGNELLRVQASGLSTRSRLKTTKISHPKTSTHRRIFSDCRFSDGARLQVGGAGAGTRSVVTDVQSHLGARCIAAEDSAGKQTGTEARGRRGSASAPTSY